MVGFDRDQSVLGRRGQEGVQHKALLEAKNNYSATEVDICRIAVAALSRVMPRRRCAVSSRRYAAFPTVQTYTMNSASRTASRAKWIWPSNITSGL